MCYPRYGFAIPGRGADGGSKPLMRALEDDGRAVICAHHTDPLFQESLGTTILYCEGPSPAAFHRKRD